MQRLPARGVAAHRGGPAAAPENTRLALCTAVRLGAAMVEFDVRRARDGELVVMHDETVDRTTNGTGAVADQSLDELRRWNAGQGESIPTLREALAALPRDVWINVQIKRGERIGAEVAGEIERAARLRQAFIACGNAEGRAARAAQPEVLLCNLVRQESRDAYLEHARATDSCFIQFHHWRGVPEPEIVERCHAAGLRVIHFCTPAAEELAAVFRAGVDFALVDDVRRGLRVQEACDA